MSILRPFRGIRLQDESSFSVKDSGANDTLFRFIKPEILPKIDSGVYVCEDKPSYYIYQQVSLGFKTTGLVALTSIDAVFNSTVKTHEEVLSEKLAITKDSIKNVYTQINPVLLIYGVFPNIQPKTAMS